MRLTLARPFGFCLATIFFAFSALAQNPTRNDPLNSARNNHVIRGKVFMPDNRTPERRVRVVLELTMGGIAGEAFTDSVGSFEFRSLASSNYRVTVPSDGQTYETAQETVEVSGPVARTFMVQLYLREKRSDPNTTKDKTISSFVQEVPKNARKNFEQAVKKLKEGKNDEAFTALQAAITDFPEYVMAHDKLGQYYLAQQKLVEAQTEFEKAIAINSKFALSHLNLGIVYTQQDRYDDAIAQLETANRLDESYPMSHLYLGINLLTQSAQQPEKLEAAEHAFQRAIVLGGNTMAQAHKYIFNINLRRKEYDKAASELEAYLVAAPNAADAPQIKSMLERIRKQGTPAKTQ